MADGTGFTSMARRRPSAADGNGTPRLGIGMLGYAFMGKAHTNAYKTMPYMIYPPPAVPHLAAICGRDAEAVAEAAQRYGYERYHTGWRELVADPAVDILDNGAPNHLHAAPSIAELEAGKHVICEKPMARDAAEAEEMLGAARRASSKHMVAFNYRFVPAIRLAWDLLHNGALGQIYHFRAVYLQEWLMAHQGTEYTWRSNADQAGSGAVGDLGQGHLIGWEHTFIHELAHFLDCIVHDKAVGPHGATFEDGYRAAVVCDAILASARARRQIDIKP